MVSITFVRGSTDSDFKVIGVKKGHVHELFELLVKKHKFEAKSGESLLHQTHEKANLLLGLGDCSTLYEFEKSGAQLAVAVKKWPAGTISVSLPGLSGIEVAHVASGLELRSWNFDIYKTKKEQKIHNFVFELDRNQEDAEEIFQELSKVNAGNITTRLVVSEPPNVLHPESYAERIRTDLEPLGIKVTILDEDQMKTLGLHALLAVGAGSARGSRLVAMEYYGADDKNEKPLALVGKGVTFDTGGISIKPSANMEDMRYDMAGSGAVYGLMKVLALRKAKVNAVGIVGLVENMPSGTSYRPADIISSYAGKTIEVLNTDAEGRIVLADALWYAQTHYNPKLVIDLATLTGAITVALGHEFAGLFSNDKVLEQQLIDAGQVVGEKLWPMPLCEAFDKDIDSDMADVKNTGSGRGAGSSTAAQFLKRFVKEDMPWAHLDIANIAWDKSEKPLTGKGATGYGVRLLNEFIKKHYG